jgi:Phytanoyl-CoA dioxygenase (PhyH)
MKLLQWNNLSSTNLYFVSKTVLLFIFIFATWSIVFWIRISYFILWHTNMADPWNVFSGDDEEGDDDDDDLNQESENEEYFVACSVVSVLAQRWLNHAAESLQFRRVLILVTNKAESVESSDRVAVWKDVFVSKQIHDVTVLEFSLDADTNFENRMIESLFDVVLLLSPSQIPLAQLQPAIRIVETTLVSGGFFLLHPLFSAADSLPLSDAVWDLGSRWDIPVRGANSSSVWSLYTRWPCEVDTESCPWLSSHHSVAQERQHLAAASVALSVQERTSGSLHGASLRNAESALRMHGYCIISGLLHAERSKCLQYGEAAKSDLNAAAAILKEQGIDLFQPSASTKEPDAYRELSMREDCRMDLRHGPALSALRSSKGNSSITYTALDQEDKDAFLRGNANILSIVRRVMNPPVSKERSAGNYGRYNFQGRGPDGSDRDVVAGPVGAILNLPGSADQAIHADTPHLFEHVVDPSPLPPHYINIFTLGCPAMQHVGQTAFVHGSHSLEFVSSHIRQGTKECEQSVDPFLPSVWKYLVRPRMELGDVLLFDCRILHFGLGNQHPSFVRPMLYTNITLHWFHDPKNWDEHACIFKDDSNADK